MMVTENVPGTFQLRVFEEIPPFQINATTQFDIYILKKGFEEVGIKIRDPKITKKGNMKFDEIEVKVMTERHGVLERWFKISVPLKKQFKLKDNNIQQLNQQLKNTLKDYSKQSKLISEWCDSEIHSLIKVNKRKSKGFFEETGTLILQKIFPEQQPHPHYYRTTCYESLSVEYFQGKSIDTNMSYPHLIHKIYA